MVTASFFLLLSDVQYGPFLNNVNNFYTGTKF